MLGPLTIVPFCVLLTKASCLAGLLCWPKGLRRGSHIWTRPQVTCSWACWWALLILKQGVLTSVTTIVNTALIDLLMSNLFHQDHLTGIHNRFLRLVLCYYVIYIYIIYNINSYIIATTWLFTSAVLHLSTPFGSWSQLNPVDSSTHLRFGGFLVNQLPWNPNGYPNEKLHFLDLILSLGLKTSFAHILWSPHQYVIICPYPLLWMRT